MLGQRFPEVEWRGQDRKSREDAIRDCDVWLGLGPLTDGPDLVEELAWCRQYGKPVYFLGVGEEGLDDAAWRGALGQARHLWARDEHSAGQLAKLVGQRVSLGADPAHLVLRAEAERPPRPGSLGLVIHTRGEGPGPGGLYPVLETDRWTPHWLAQEARPLPGSERHLYDDLPAPRRAGLPLGSPAPMATTIRQLVHAWPVPEVLLASRYHALLWGGWHGCRLVALGDETRAMAQELGIVHLPAFDGPSVLAALERGASVRRTRLEAQARRAEAVCRELLAALPCPPEPARVSR